MVATIDGSGRGAGRSEQMGGDVDTDRFAGELRNQGAKVFSRQLLPGGRGPSEGRWGSRPTMVLRRLSPAARSDAAAAIRRSRRFQHSTAAPECVGLRHQWPGSSYAPVVRVAIDDALIDGVWLDTDTRAESHQRHQSVARAPVRQLDAKPIPGRRQRHAVRENIFLLGKPDQRGLGIGSMVGQRLWHPVQRSMVQCHHPDPDGAIACRDQLWRLVKRLGDPQQ